MAFESQSAQSKYSQRRSACGDIVATQSIKLSSNSMELSFRLSSSTLAKAGLNINDRVDVLFDKDTNRWMIKEDQKGFLITGKNGAPTALIRYTLKDNHARITMDDKDLPCKRACKADSLITLEKSIIFSLEESKSDAC